MRAGTKQRLKPSAINITVASNGSVNRDASPDHYPDELDQIQLLHREFEKVDQENINFEQALRLEAEEILEGPEWGVPLQTVTYSEPI